MVFPREKRQIPKNHLFGKSSKKGQKWSQKGCQNPPKIAPKIDAKKGSKKGRLKFYPAEIGGSPAECAVAPGGRGVNLTELKKNKLKENKLKRPNEGGQKGGVQKEECKRGVQKG